jgi:hypothetical protein
VNGSIGVIATLSEFDFKFLQKLENVMQEVVPYVGGFSHQEY